MPAPNHPQQKIGEILVRAGSMSEDQVMEVLRAQREAAGFDKLFGELAVELRFVDQETIESYLQGADD